MEGIVFVWGRTQSHRFNPEIPDVEQRIIKAVETKGMVYSGNFFVTPSDKNPPYRVSMRRKFYDGAHMTEMKLQTRNWHHKDGSEYKDEGNNVTRVHIASVPDSVYEALWHALCKEVDPEATPRFRRGSL